MQVLVAPEACHESDVRCLAVRRQFVNILLEKGLLKVVTELQDTVEDNLFGVSLLVWLLGSAMPVIFAAMHHFTAAGAQLVAAQLGAEVGGCPHLHWTFADSSELLRTYTH